MPMSMLLLVVMALSYFKTIANTLHKFLLAGQSNMSGQGGVVNNIWDGIFPEECNPNPAILKLDAHLQWVEAKEPLHVGIETKYVSCGIGPAKSQVKNIFLLAGQSNMSGLGGVVNNTWDGVVPAECSPNPAILKLDAKFQWVEAKEPLHADIDMNVTCGIGPGMPFANSLVNSGVVRTVGLVPCAMAGNKIIEWQKGTFLYNQLVMRATAPAVQECGVIRAMLWYQGESDTTRIINADGYKGKMQQFFTDLRSDLALPELLIIQVALASGLNFTEEVREAQLNPGLPNVVTVDAKGLQLEKDNLHLTASSQVILGQMMADAFLHTT